MRAFPILKKGEMGLLLADPGTGHVLGLDLRWSMNPDEEVYRVFATEGHAVGYVEGLWATGLEVEGVLYGGGGVVLQYIRFGGGGNLEQK